MKKNRHIFAIDLQTADSAVAQRALNGETVLIYPKGTHHRYDPWEGEVRTWTVDDATVAQLVDNFAHRTERGIRQSRLPVNEDHMSSRALGWFNDVVALPEGVGGTFLWNRKGSEALQNGEFSYFSVEIYDELVDRVTGEKVHNQISGGALTNYPFFGEATSLMSRNLTGGYDMLDTPEQVEAERNWLRDLVARMFGRSETPPAGMPPALHTVEIPEELKQQLAQLQTQVQQFNAQIEGVTAERNTYAQQIKTLEGQLSAVQDARSVEHFAVLARSFGNLPAATPDLAAHLRWLHEADAGGTHRDFFTALLQKTNDTFGIYFRERGVQQGQEAGSEAQLETKVQAYIAAHPGVAYRQAVDAVMAENPDLERALQGGVR